MTADTPHHNPYDFANPITDMALLADRTKERNEIDYCLQHAATAPRPINIALIGNRASGKTSLLTEASAKKQNFFSVRVNLDSAISATQPSFFLSHL